MKPANDKAEVGITCIQVSLTHRLLFACLLKPANDKAGVGTTCILVSLTHRLLFACLLKHANDKAGVGTTCIQVSLTPKYYLHVCQTSKRKCQGWHNKQSDYFNVKNTICLSIEPATGNSQVVRKAFCLFGQENTLCGSAETAFGI